MEYDVLVIGGGIAGMESSLTLADAGFKVLLVESSPSLGGRMIQLSKVFPTTDCAGCITTPKMAATSKHENITVLTYAEVEKIENRDGEGFAVRILKKPRYIDEKKCIGCGRCEQECPIFLPDEFNFGLAGRKAAYIPFSMASPRVALIDIENCTMCGRCERVCPTDAVDFLQQPEEIEVRVKAVIVATGFKPFNPSLKREYGYDRFANVLHALEMERILSPSRPYNAIVRPSDGKIPDKVAFVLCVGSRDKSLGNPICSRVCCMYSIKQAILLSAALPLADFTIYYMDIRAYGKGFEEFYNMARDMGIRFVKGRVAKLEEKENGDIAVRVENFETGEIEEEVYDMVVLSIGLLANPDVAEIVEGLELDPFGFVMQQKSTNPVETNVSGVFVAGCAAGPKDIPDTIAEANAAASQCMAYLKALEVRK
ncbi:FAD-dependent oxidoreductase [Archaeoglobus neptunius]|uniref:FAD-dependent oxidoreductase n=1 Tax=Archaeoglobus neptunius TaxID=2798580 RepID=UPI001925950B